MLEDNKKKSDNGKMTKENIGNFSLFDIVGYSLSLVILLFFLNKESDDLFSNKEKGKKETEFGDGCGKYLITNKHHKNDTPDVIKKKIENLSNYQETLPKWRRSLTLSVMIALLLSFIFYRGLLPFNKFLMFIIVCFIVINFSFSFYSYHYDKYAIDYIKENLKHLK